MRSHHHAPTHHAPHHPGPEPHHPTKRRPLAAGVAVVVLALVTASCNDDDAAPEPAATTAPDTATTDVAGETTEAAETIEIDVVDISFDPVETTIPVGTTVVWTNLGGVSHSTTSDDGVWDSDVLAPGESFEFTFEEPGTFPYTCRLHPTQMRGTITVEG